MFSNLEYSDVMNLARPVLQMLGVKHTGHCATARHTRAPLIYVTSHVLPTGSNTGLSWLYHVKDVPQSLQFCWVA